MILRGRKPLEGPKGGANDGSLHDEHGEKDEKKGSAPSNYVIVDVHTSKEVPKDSNYTSIKPYAPLCHSHKGWLRLNLICNLSFQHIIMSRKHINLRG